MTTENYQKVALGGLLVSVLAIGPKARGFKPAVTEYIVTGCWHSWDMWLPIVLKGLS
jgi:hypothetical protein